MNKDGGPAFPNFRAEGFGSEIHDGMSLRDWLAGMVIQGMMANEDTGFNGVYVDEDGVLQPQEILLGALTSGAKVAYMTADVMLKEREKENDSPS